MFGSRVAVRSDDAVDTDGVTLGCVDQIKCIRAGWESIQIVRDRAWHIPWAVPVALALCGPLARGVGVIERVCRGLPKSESHKRPAHEECAQIRESANFERHCQGFQGAWRRRAHFALLFRQKFVTSSGRSAYCGKLLVKPQHAGIFRPPWYVMLMLSQRENMGERMIVGT